MTHDVNVQTPVGQVRLLIPDMELLPIPGEPGQFSRLFEDEEIEQYLALNGQNVKRAAASAILTIANSEAMILRTIKTEDLQTDGSKVAAQLRVNAADLRRQSYEDVGDGGALFTGGCAWPSSPWAGLF